MEQGRERYRINWAVTLSPQCTGKAGGTQRPQSTGRTSGTQILELVGKLAVALALLLPLLGGSSLCAIQVNSPAGPVQDFAGCTSGTANFCDLRVYQVMVESFVDGDPTRNYNDGYGTSHHKGDLRGIINSLDYIKGLGMNAIWMTPIFDSKAGQAMAGGGVNLKLDATGYYTRDYFKIDPKFGSLADAQELVNTAHQKGIYVFFDGVFGHHKGNLVASPTGKLPVNSSSTTVSYPSSEPAGSHSSVEFYKEVATYWINQLGIDGWRLDQSYQVPPWAWRQFRVAVETASAQRAAAGHQWGTLGYMVAEDWSDAWTIAGRTLGPDPNPILHSAFDFPVRYAIVGVVAGEENGWSGRPASVIAEEWAMGAHDNVYDDHALPNLMIGNHDFVRFGDLLQRVDLANPNEPEYWARHRLAFMFQAAYSGPITRYYGEEIGDELPGYADQVTNNCASQGLCDDHVGRTSAKILGVTVQSLSADQAALKQFHEGLMGMRRDYPALSHGERQHLFSDDVLYVDLKTFGDQQVVFAMNVSDASITVQLNQSLFDSPLTEAWDILSASQVAMAGGYLNFNVPALSGLYILVNSELHIPGDFNADGTVDAADYIVWRGDPVNYAPYDLVDWRNNFGETSGTSPGSGAVASSTIPEPGSLALLSLVLLGTIISHRARVSLRRM
jgi:glycosidase